MGLEWNFGVRDVGGDDDRVVENCFRERQVVKCTGLI